MKIRPTINVTAAAGGWPHPWPNVAELAGALPVGSWTLIGGLMTQLHTIHRGFGIIRPTSDVDIVLHIEAQRGLPNTVAAALEGLGYRLRPSLDERSTMAHRFVRGKSTVDVVAGRAEEDQVDAMIADHAAPKAIEKLRGKDMVRIEGGTQALRRTINAQLSFGTPEPVTISVPRPFGAVILKAAASIANTRDPERHLFDAAALLACIEDPFSERAEFTGSDRRRITALARQLPGNHRPWRALPEAHRIQAQLALDILISPSDTGA